MTLNPFIKSKLIITCFTALAILLFARCTEKETAPKQPEPLPDFEAIDNAKEWFNGETGGNVSVHVDPKTKSSAINPQSVQLYGKWGESQTKDLGDIKNVETPVFKLQDNPDSSDENCTSCLKSGSENHSGRSHTRFVIQTDEKTGETRGFMMTVIPTEEYLASGKDIEDIDYYNRGEDFCGLIVFNNLDGSFANAWNYKEGEIVHGYIRKKRNIAQNKLKAMAKIEYTWCSQVKVETETYTYYNDKKNAGLPMNIFTITNIKGTISIVTLIQEFQAVEEAVVKKMIKKESFYHMTPLKKSL